MIVVLVVVIFRTVVVCIRSGTTTGVVSTLVDEWDIHRRMGTRDHLFARTFVERRRARRGKSRRSPQRRKGKRGKGKGRMQRASQGRMLLD